MNDITAVELLYATLYAFRLQGKAESAAEFAEAKATRLSVGLAIKQFLDMPEYPIE